jgi:Leucine-rich repeat (LRR) protein
MNIYFTCVYNNIKLDENTLVKFSNDSPQLVNVLFEDSVLHKIPKHIFKQRNQVKSLNVQNTQIKVLTRDALIDGVNLEELNLGGNKLLLLANEVFDGPQFLTTIDLSNNMLSKIEVGVFENLKYLVKLNLSGNDLHDLEFLEPIENLIDLDLSNNRIEHLLITTLTKMKKLKTLILRRNHLQWNPFQFGTFTSQSKLELLDLSNNKLDELELDMMLSLENLQTLLLHENRLKFFSCKFDSLKTFLPKLKQVGLSNNNWFCSDLAALFIILKNSHIQVVEHGDMVLTESNVKGVKCYLSHNINNGLDPI